MRQDTSQWIEGVNLEYHESQYDNPYQSTIAFCNYLKSKQLLTSESKFTIVDVGAGLGGNIYYLSSQFPNCTFLGIDLNPDLVNRGNEILRAKRVENCNLIVGDIYSLDKMHFPEINGIVSFQTLSWLPGYEAALQQLCGLNADWIALSSLFYEGRVSCKIEVSEYEESLQVSRNSFYNVYSLPIIKDFLKNFGYKSFDFIPFEIDIDLDKPNEHVMGTYTEKTKGGKRIQISGPLMLPWYFVSALNDF